MVKQYRKKPVIIEAIQFVGNDAECMAFCPTARDPEDTKPNLIIPTLEGEHLCSVGDYIIKGVKGEFYPCKPDVFEMTYEPMMPAPKPCPECGGCREIPNRQYCLVDRCTVTTCPDHYGHCPVSKPCPTCQGGR